MLGGVVSVHHCGLASPPLVSACCREMDKIYHQFVGVINCASRQTSGSVVRIADCGPKGREFSAPLCSSCPVRRDGLSS